MLDILDLVQSELNFTVSIVPTADGKYGSLHKNNTWSGQIGMIQRREIDFSIMDMSITLERTEVRSAAHLIRPNRILT